MKVQIKSLIGILFLLFSLSSAEAKAQVSLSQTTCPGSGCTDVNAVNSGSIAIQITGTWVGTITFKSTVDNSTYTDLRVVSAADTTSAGVTTTTANGTWQGTITGFSKVRIVFTAFTSGTAVVSTRMMNTAAKFNNGTGGVIGVTCPGSSNTEVLFNNAGVCDGDAGLTYVPATDALTVAGTITAGSNTFKADGWGIMIGASGVDTAIAAGDYGDIPLYMYASFIEIDSLVGIGAAPPTIGTAQFGVFRSLDNTLSTGAETVNIFQHDITATDLAATNSLNNLKIQTRFGLGGVASLGLPILRNEQLDIIGSGSADNEFNINTSQLLVNIGTGFTQTAGPTGFITFADNRMEGPVAVQPRSLFGNGQTCNNYYNGSPAYATANCGFTATYYASSNEAIHLAADTFPYNLGYWIGGISHHGGNDDVGFTIALQIGDGITPSGVWSDSRIGTAIKIRDAYTIVEDLASAEATDFISKWASDDGDDATDTWTWTGASSNNTLTLSNNSVNLFQLHPTAGNLVIGGATASVSDTSADSCGTGTQTIVGNDNAGKVTVIGSAGTSCTVTFATAFTNAPSCTVTNETTAALVRATSATGTVILAGTFAQNDVLAYICIGRQ